MSSAVSNGQGSSIECNYGRAQEKGKGNRFFNGIYSIQRCVHHPDKQYTLTMPARQLLITEMSEFTTDEVNDAIRGRTRPFHSVVGEFRKEDKVDLFCTPLTFYVQKDHICVEIARAECFCKHNFYVEKRNFYNIIREVQVPTLDIQVEADGDELFEFLAFTLPGTWCRELKALNVVFNKKIYLEPLSTLLKKSRMLSRLRIAHSAKEIVRVSDFIKNMACLEELELNCPDHNDSGFLLDKQTMKFIVELEKRTGAEKPFRSLKAFNASFNFTAREFIKECVRLAKLSHNSTYKQYETINEIRGRGGVDVEARDTTINFEVTPRFPVKLSNEVFVELCRKSKSYLVNFDSRSPQFRYFMIRHSLFRLIDRD
ncbi:unnamed protein product [Caenorhabditis sp. 36 PRJEB53466]|nr:unnamed protein product [Caenorhabditis sp. 36 PRJEB53466]